MTDLARAVRPRRRVLLTTLRYPPQKGVGIFRTMKFQRHLPDYGWRADVLTGPRDGDARRQVVTEPAAEGEGAVFRIPFPDPDALARRLATAATGRLMGPALELLARAILVAGQRLMVPDAQLGFAWGVLGHCQEVVRPGSYHVLFSTGKPWSTHLGSLVLKRWLQVPWVADFRDPWLLPSERDTVRHGIDRRLERLVIRNADRILTCAGGLRHDLLRRHADLLDERRVFLVRNGYDEEVFEGLEPRPAEDTFVITHAGALWGSSRLATFMSALQDVARAPDPGSRPFRVEFVGPYRKADVRRVAELGLDEVVRFEGVVPHREAVERLISADLLLVVDVDHDRAPRLRLTSKLYEYFRTGRRILLLSSGGESEDLVRDCDRVEVVSKDDPAAIAAGMRRILSLPPLPPLTVPDELALRYERRQITERFAGILDELVAS